LTTTKIKIADEIRRAIETDAPVVALESTLLAHGMPWPQSLEVGRALEAAVREAGAIPATIAVVGGVPHVGLDDATLEQVAREGGRFRKANATDLPVAIARGLDAATTVSGTAFLAARAGIRIFSTGGIGGVHRGDSGDVSNDLTLLADTKICVVSAGPKAILDLPRTVETLETFGVLILGYRTSELPAFYTRSSGVALEHRVETAEEVAAILEARWSLGQGGVLVANPIPEADELNAEMIGRAITMALNRAETRGVKGKALTPFLLSELARTTAGRAPVANRALAVHNARLAAEIARAMC
jgi:pseudouridine-5'-phosphate glycosidase